MNYHIFSQFNLQTRLMNQRSIPKNANEAQTKSHSMYKGSIDCGIRTVRNEGFAALYKGFIPTWFRMGPWNVIFFITYEQLKQFYWMPKTNKQKKKPKIESHSTYFDNIHETDQHTWITIVLSEFLSLPLCPFIHNCLPIWSIIISHVGSKVILKHKFIETKSIKIEKENIKTKPKLCKPTQLYIYVIYIYSRSVSIVEMVLQCILPSVHYYIIVTANINRMDWFECAIS